MNKTYIWIGLVAVVIIAAGAYFVYGGSAGSSFDNKSFTLASYNGAAIPAGESYTLSFSNGSIHVQFCNTMNGPYSLSGGSLTATLAATQKFCPIPADSMMLESAFGQILGAGATASLSGTTLTLAGAGGSMTFTQSQ